VAKRSALPETDLQVTVLDMQPIDPPVGGGRLRLLGLYHGLGAPTTYVGTYDWPGERLRDHRLSPTLREIDVPLSEEHHAAAKALSEQLGGKVVIDSAFHRFAHLSNDFNETALAEAADSDIVIFSHPWLYPQLFDAIDRDRQLLVYDSHNVEGYLRYTLLDDGSGDGSELCREVVHLEASLCRDADLVLACSHRDRELFHHLYAIPFAKVYVVPNGVFTTDIVPSTVDEKRRARSVLDLSDATMAIFLGSPYGPNVEAAEFIVDVLALAVPDMTFVIAGGVGTALLDRRRIPGNVRITGQISEEEKRYYLQAVDLAVNPMFSGSGTNIKMLEFMAAGLPIVTTPVGARGLRGVQPSPFAEAKAEDMPAVLRELQADAAERARLSAAARSEALEAYSWDRISADLGSLLVDHVRNRHDRPFYSVVVPTFDRHDHLSALMARLSQQTCRDCEILVIDQSAALWPERDKDWNVRLRYFHTDVRGAVNARNRGAYYARGEVIAFIDDDCLPNADWLASARRYFSQPNVGGVEGLIVSAEHDNPAFRSVSNEGFSGMGFMTANLFIRRETFYALDGFDIAFDRPHFREDTDLGWRALQLGNIPFAEDVVVFHPPHPVSRERESQDARAKFFEKDALLFQKHPDRYKALFLAEGHWNKTSGFWEHFLRGHEKYGVGLDPFFRSFMKRCDVR
jgi:glycosyltransferase involved in cell wall biosynthesis/GT2 family glycosyltransferase